MVIVGLLPNKTEKVEVFNEYIYVVCQEKTNEVFLAENDDEIFSTVAVTKVGVT